ncbi:MAG: DoxX family protein [Bacteroidales bacterium]|nr:DoxX family protein [Bacteroidales bacterium]
MASHTGRLRGWIIICAALLSGYLISIYDSYNLFYLLILLALLVFSGISHKSYTTGQIKFCRLLIGLVFMYSGIVKGIDPLGTQYRIQDYFIAFDMDWAIPFSLFLSVILNSFEFVMGVLILFNVHMRLVAWLLVLLMSFCTLTTLNDALYNPVPDCGCFGDAIILTNLQTLYKNLVINVFVLIVLAGRKRTGKIFRPGIQWAIFILTVGLFTGFEIYNIRHLPLLDFRDWKVGKKMAIDNPMPKKFYVIYKNKNSGIEKEYPASGYPFNDSVWMSQWEFVNQRVEDPNPKLHHLSITNDEGDDYTADFIENPELQIIFVAYDINKMKTCQISAIKEIIDGCEQDGFSAVFLTSSLPEEVLDFRDQHDLLADFYYADDTELLAMIRSNPGLIVIKGSVILGKWHNKDLPEYNQIKDYSIQK